MHNKKYYLVSPRVDGNSIQGFIETMFEQHIVMMGWGTDNKIGADFNNLKKGDFVIVAQRVNWVFTYYFAGIIDDEKAFSNEDGIFCRRLRGFIDLRDDKEDYLADASFASMSVIKAMMSINPSNNPEVVKKLDKIIAMQENKDYMNSFVSLLKSNYNLILTGAPGTGKTYLAKEIAKAMGGTENEIKLVQFHPSYDYTDFVEGLRPIKEGNTLGFQRKDGVFKAFCKKAIDSVKLEKEDSVEFDPTFEQAYNILLSEARLNKEIKGCRVNKFDIESKKIESVTPKGDIITFVGHHPVNKTSLYKLYKFYGSLSNMDFKKKMIYTYNISPKNLPYFLTSVSRIFNIITENNIKNSSDQVKKDAVVEDKKFIFIIDEINRGEISKIFGELFFSIDGGYRGVKGKVDTQYQNLIPKEGDADFTSNSADVFRNGFYVPENVYIIGTMNDIDRSVESMDFAMRRRFAWKEITVESRLSMLDDEESWGGYKPNQEVIDEIKIRMKNLNDCIIDKYGDEELSPKDKIGLTKAYQIGASYFLKYGQYENFDDLWSNHLEGVLYEYLRGTTNVENKMYRLRTAYNDIIAH